MLLARGRGRRDPKGGVEEEEEGKRSACGVQTRKEETADGSPCTTSSLAQTAAAEAAGGGPPPPARLYLASRFCSAMLHLLPWKEGGGKEEAEEAGTGKEATITGGGRAGGKGGPGERTVPKGVVKAAS